MCVPMLVFSALTCVLAPGPMASKPSEEVVRLGNAELSVGISTRDGAIVSVRNERAGLELVSRMSEERQPFLMLLDGNEFVGRATRFHIERADEAGLERVDLSWATEHGITVRATLELPVESDEIIVRCEARNLGQRTILALNYPRLAGIGPIGDGSSADYLLHSAMGGALVRDPFSLFSTQPAIPQGRGFLPSRYPSGFAGSTMQMMAYYQQGVGGFYLAAEDTHLTDKDLNFYKIGDNDQLAWEIAHFQWDARPGRSLRPEYPIVLAALTEGTWYEAAERYRTWAVRQPWCERGTRRERVQRGDASRWLLEDTGAVTMWAPFEADIRQIVADMHDLFGAPILHLPMKWTHEESVAAARASGDRLGPFYFPFLALEDGPTFATCAGDMLQPRTQTVAPQWVAMCPVQPEWRRTVVESAVDLAGAGPQRHHNVWIDGNPTGCAADSLYYDVGPCAGVPTHCFSTDHEHPPGTGRGITGAYISLTEETQMAASQVRGAYVPVGTECASEPFVGCLDTYYPRSAGMDLTMELMAYTRFLTWIPDGQMEIVPLFEFVYHEYGPLGMQGLQAAYPWAGPVGDALWTWGEARATLWGQLVVSHPVYPGAQISEQRRAFIRSMTAARTGFATDFLAYGRMEGTPVIDAGSIDLDHGLGVDGWLRKLALTPTQTTEEALPEHGDWSVEEWIGTMLTIPSTPAHSSHLTIPAVQAQAYTFDGRLGILMINLRRDAAASVNVAIDPEAYGLPAGSYIVQRVSADGAETLAELAGMGHVTVDLPPWEFVLVEARRVG